MTESELIEGIIHKNETAFKELVFLYQQQVINTCYGFLGNYNDAEDVSQDVFIEVYESINKFRRESKLSTWIYRIAVNKSINYKRVIKRRQWVKSLESIIGKESTEIQKVSVHQSDMTNDSIDIKERKIVIAKALDKLPERQKIAFTLHKNNDMSYLQVAEVMHVTLPTVESLIHRAKLNLQKFLVNYYS